MNNTIEKWLDGLLDYEPKTKQQIKTETKKNKVITDRGWFRWRHIEEDEDKEFGFVRGNLFTSLISGRKKEMN